MRKKLKPKPTAILTSDWHIRGDRPVCRTDDFKTALKNKLITILALGEKYQCPIILAGDVGLKPIWGDKLLNWAIDILQTFDDTEILAIAGQHDLINHRL
ncbi:hypothetical protein HN682_00990, partial [Candidatus Peregrinibacteria bacterium]|nr:hypothetical protein [Candidatus Peregrinibacteria bacterium]